MQDLIGRTLGHYRIVEKIGEGGMGVVYRARDERLDRDVAVKVLPEEVAADADRLRRFETEAKAVAQLDHPNILAIHDFRTEDGVAYAVMELLEGESLRELISEGSITTGKAVEYARAIADGLAAAHDKNIIHRDLKPENVFLTTDGRIKILDFGLAKLKLPEADLTTETPTATLDTAAGGLIGTVPYMAPEQVQGQPADHRSDIFALGVVLYEMLTGHRPFGGSTTVETAAAILKEDPEPISVAAPAVPPTLGSVVSKCLEKRPEDRFSSAHDLSLTLGAIDFTAPAPPVHDRLVIGKRWPHILAVVIAAAIALFFVFPPEGLFERLAEQPAEAAPPRIVVLPFENLGSPEDEFFASGITEEITSRLAAVSGLQVISRTSARTYQGTNKNVREIGEELDVGYVLEGTIRWDRSGEGHGRVRITPQLIKVADDSHLWSERYDRVLEDIFAVQTEIAEQVIDKLEANLLGPERRAIEARPTENMEAYQAYLLGLQYWWTGEDEPTARMMLEMLKRAVTLDPDFALAHALLSQAHSQYYHYKYDFTPSRQLKARQSAERALDLKSELTEAHLALGWYYYWCHRDYGAALAEIAKAEKGRPNNPDVLTVKWAVFRRMGRWQDAVATLVRAMEIDPRGYLTTYETGATLTVMRQYARAEEYITRAIEIAPDRPDAYSYAVTNYILWDGGTERARSVLFGVPTLSDPRLLYASLILDYYDRDFDALLAGIAEPQNDVLALEDAYLPKELLRCVALDAAGDDENASAACESAVSVLNREIERRSYDYRLHSALGRAYARLGRSEDAVASSERAVELWPLSRDAFEGARPAIDLAKVNARVGNHGKAIDQLENLLSIPCRLSVPLLRLDPVWDPLRDHPRFQALLEKYDTN